MPAAAKPKSLHDHPVVGKLLEAVLQLEARFPLTYWSVGLATLSLLWAILDLMAHTLQAG